MMPLLLIIALFIPAHVSAAIKYISPTGSNSNNGTSSATPWLTFTHAFANTSCGDVLVLLDGDYGDGKSTGKINLDGRTCSTGNEFSIQAFNSRQVKVVDNSGGIACQIRRSAYINFDGMYCRSTDNSSFTSSEQGVPIMIKQSSHIQLRLCVANNPNRYGSNAAVSIYYSADILAEDCEVYGAHRHFFNGFRSERVVVRRGYCNGRGGRIAGGFLNGNPAGTTDACFSMYPCRDCICENCVADGTTTPLYLNEMNATYQAPVGTNATPYVPGPVLLTGSKVLGSICYKCDWSVGIFPGGRDVADANHSPQKIVIRDNVFIDHGSRSASIRCSDCAEADGVPGGTIDHNTVLGTGAGGGSGSAAYGIYMNDKTGEGVTLAGMWTVVTNNLVYNRPLTGILPAGNKWTVDHNISNANGTNYNPSSDPASADQTFSNNTSVAPGYGTCKGLWVPSGAPGKGAGTNGTDIGANILYRTVNGVLTTVPLWDKDTGEFPHGAFTQDGVNHVAGNSLYDIHERLNVNRNGCFFPTGYGEEGSSGVPPPTPGEVIATTDLTGPHIHTVDAVANNSMIVAVMVKHDALAADHATALDSSCGSESYAPLDTWITTLAGDRTLRLFAKLSPTAGTCTLTPTFSGGNVSGYVIVSREESNVGSFGAVSSNVALSLTPTVTVTTNTGEKVIDFLATSSSPTLTVGVDQTLVIDRVHATKSLRGASSIQAGGAGGVMSYSLSTQVGWLMQAISLIPPSAPPPSGSTLTQTRWRIYEGYGSESGSNPQADLNTQARISQTGLFRPRFEIRGTVDTTNPFGVALFCRKNADNYTRVMDAFGSNVFRYFGAGTEIERPRIPASLTPTTQRLQDPVTLDFVPGAFLRDQSSAFVVPALEVGQRTELSFAVVLNASVDDVINCRVHKDDGSQLDAYTTVSSVLVIPTREIKGY